MLYSGYNDIPPVIENQMEKTTELEWKLLFQASGLRV